MESDEADDLQLFSQKKVFDDRFSSSTTFQGSIETLRAMPDTAQLPLSSKRRKVDSNETTSKPSKVPQIFSPFRTIGVVSNHVPPSIQVRGKAYLVTTSVGKAFQTWDV